MALGLVVRVVHCSLMGVGWIQLIVFYFLFLQISVGYYV